MRLLLDTNIYVYMVSDQKSLTKDVCAYLEDGVITKIGPTAEVLDDKSVRNSYLGL